MREDIGSWARVIAFEVYKVSQRYAVVQLWLDRVAVPSCYTIPAKFINFSSKSRTISQRASPHNADQREDSRETSSHEIAECE